MKYESNACSNCDGVGHCQYCGSWTTSSYPGLGNPLGRRLTKEELNALAEQTTQEIEERRAECLASPKYNVGDLVWWFRVHPTKWSKQIDRLPAVVTKKYTENGYQISIPVGLGDVILKIVGPDRLKPREDDVYHE